MQAEGNRSVICRENLASGLSHSNGFRDQSGSVKIGYYFCVVCTCFLLVIVSVQVFSISADLSTICDIVWTSTWHLGSVRLFLLLYIIPG